MNKSQRRLLAVYARVSSNKRIIFRYQMGRWDYVDSFHPHTIGEALKVAFERIEEARPGTLARAAQLDDDDFQTNKRRKRRYVAESRDLLYIESPYLEPESDTASGYWFITNIPWSNVPAMLRLACKAAEVQYGLVAI